MAIDLTDQSPNSNTLTNNGATESSDTPFAQSSVAVDLELSEGDYLWAADSASLSITGDITIEAWVKWENVPANNVSSYVVAKWEVAGSGLSYGAYLFNNAGQMTMRFILSSDGTTSNFDIHSIDIATPNTGQYYHYAWVFDASTATAELFIDVVSQGTSTDTETSIADTDTTVRIGSRQESPFDYVDGIVDEVRIWNDKRTSEELGKNKNKRLIGNESGLVAYWPFEALSTLTSAFTADGLVVSQLTKTFTADGVVAAGLTKTFTSDGIVATRLTSTFTIDGIIGPRYYFLGGEALPRPKFFRRDPIFIKSDVTTLSGRTGRDIVGRKERFVIGWSLLSADELTDIIDLVEQDTPLDFEVRDRDLQIKPTSVITTIRRVTYRIPGGDYIPITQLELVEVT